MSPKSKIPLSNVKVGLNIFAMILLIAAIVMSSCSKTKPEEQEPPVETSETLRFVFLADSRGDTLTYPVNDTVLTAIISQIGALSPRPSFVLFGGDMSYRGWIHNNYTFQAWADLFTPLTSNGITLYTAIGNHELYHEHSSLGFWLLNQQKFQGTFIGNPANGPAGHEHLAYSFSSPGANSFFAVLDPYFMSKDTTLPKHLGGNIESAEMTWLKAQVAQTKATHKFLFIHTPYYYISKDTAEPAFANQSYTALWSFLDSNKFDLYACGHSHLFSRRTIDSTLLPYPQTTPPTPKWKNNVVQLLNGTCGAGPDTGTIDPAVKTAWNICNDPQTYYFSVVDINGSTVKVTSYKGCTGAYSLFDTFTITK